MFYQKVFNRISTVIISMMFLFMLVGEPLDLLAKGSSSSSRSSSSSSRSSSFSGSKSTSTSPSKSSWGSSSKSSVKTPSASTTKTFWGSTNNSLRSPSQPRLVSNRSAVMKTRQMNAVQAENYAKTSTPADWNKSRSTWTTNKPYSNYRPTFSGTRYTGQQRTVVINRYHNEYGGYAFNDPFNHALIWTFSTMWWYHHWNEVDKSMYANDIRMKQLEAEVAAMRAKGMPVVSNYQDNGMNQAVMYSDGYLNAAKSGKLKTKDPWGTATRVLILVGFVAAIGGVGYISYRIFRA